MTKTILTLSSDKFKPTAFESAGYVFGDPVVRGLIVDCHDRYPDYGKVEDLDAATEHIVTRLEEIHAKRYDAEDWIGIRQLLCKEARSTLVFDRSLIERRKPGS